MSNFVHFATVYYLTLVRTGGGIMGDATSRSFPELHAERLTRVLLGYFFVTQLTGGAIFAPPLISETTGPFVKF